MAVAAAMANPVSLQAPSAGACAMQAAWHLVNVLPTPAADCNDLQDLDADGIADGADNCVFTANPSQADADFDDVGDLCDQDRDGDGVVNDEDNCPDQLNPGQQDAGNDGEGDACDEDADNDGLLDDLDNCPLDDNPDQIDSDADGDGDACDPDTDGDDVWGFDDNCPFLANADQADVDGDDIGDVCDPCPAGFDEVVASSSGNPDLGVGPSLVLSDLDGDGVADGCDAYPLTPTAVSIAGAPVPPGGLAPNLVDAIMNVALGGGIATVPVALPESPPVGSDDDTLIVNATLPPGISAALVGPHGAVESGAHGPGVVTLKGKRMSKKPLKLWLYGPPGTTADVSVSIEVGSSHDEASPCAGAHDGVRCAPEGLPGVMGLCLEEECATSICGDLLIDHADGEECEDGNAIDGDGCDNDCRYSCHNHLECGDDNERCNGDEMCINHVCQYGAGITCDDDNACTENVCVDSECSFPLIEGDGDGDGPARACGGDCHDTNPDVHSHQLGAFTVGYCQFGSTCPPDEVSFDYDCDRLEEAVDIDLAGTCQPNGSGGCRGSGWVSLEVTPCGESADYQTCTFNGTDCDATIAPLTQACR
ncbi:MAG: thrombospondin type 3 repeat-containing protein [Deltaproteobacteria bacterium]|nr:thrombospondin type 3 repeat-containing protein [Deltaproteobacteria bacterium]